MTMPAAVMPSVPTPTRAQPDRRNVELLLLVFAWGLGVLGTLQIGWAIGEEPDSRLWITSGVVGALALVMHVVVRWKARYADPFLLPVATLLTILGLVMIYRLDVAAARRAELNGNPAPTPDAYSQLTWFAVAVILFVSVLILLRDHRVLQRYTYTLGLVGLILLVVSLILRSRAKKRGENRQTLFLLLAVLGGLLALAGAVTLVLFLLMLY